MLVCTADDFPTDRYIVAGVAESRGLTVRQIPADIDEGLDAAALAAALDDRVAVVVLSHVAYRSGALADLTALTRLVHDAGALVLWDLSHSAGAVPVELAAAGADLAVGCTYKYLNGGPGAPAFLYVRQRAPAAAALTDPGLVRPAGPVRDGPGVRPGTGHRAVRRRHPAGARRRRRSRSARRWWPRPASAALAAKGRAMTDLAVALGDAWLRPHGVVLASPRDPARRGSHVTFAHAQAWQVTQALLDRRVVPDFRTPDRVRLGPAPLYTRFVDVWDAMDRFRAVLAERAFEAYPAERSPRHLTDRDHAGSGAPIGFRSGHSPAATTARRTGASSSRQPVAARVADRPPRVDGEAVGVGLDGGDHRQPLGGEFAVGEPAAAGERFRRGVPGGVVPAAGRMQPLAGAAAGRGGQHVRRRAGRSRAGAARRCGRRRGARAGS